LLGGFTDEMTMYMLYMYPFEFCIALLYPNFDDSPALHHVTTSCSEY